MTERKVSLQTFFILSAVFIAIGLGIGSGITYDSKVNDIVEAQDEDRVCHDDAACQNWLNQNYVSKDLMEFEIKKIKDAIAHPHTEFASIAPALTKLNNEVAQLKIDVAVLKTKPTVPTPKTSDFDLVVCEDVNCVNDGDRFKQGETVYVQGKNPTSDRQLDYEIRDPNDNRIKSGSIGVIAGSPFTVIWIIPDDAEDGRYTMIVEIDKDEDEIDFIIT